MSGTWWALAAGMGFGLFQAANRRAVRDLDVYLSTFLQLVFSSVVLGSIAAATGELSLLRTMRLPALIDFAMSGLLHFFIGWTLLNASQKRIGAARTSPLLSTVPLFGTVVAALALREIPGVVALIGVGLVVGGVYLISNRQAGDSHALAGRPERPVPLDVGWRGSLFGLGAALCWSISPVFVRRGLAELPSPLLGLLIGILASLVAYGVGMPFWRHAMGGRMRADTLTFKFIAGSLVGLSQWARWIALGLAPVGVVLSLTQVSVPVAILLSPVFVGRQLEQVTARVWLGATVVICGSVLLVFTR